MRIDSGSNLNTTEIHAKKKKFNSKNADNEFKKKKNFF